MSLQRTPGSAIVGTECLEPAEVLTPPFLTAGGTASGTTSGGRSGQALVVTPGAPGGLVVGESQAADPADRSFARLNFDEVAMEWVAGVDAQGTRLLRQRRPVSLEGQALAALTFVSSVQGGAGLAEVQVSVDGLTWRTVARIPPDEAWTEVHVDLSEFAGHRVYVQFAYTPLLGETAVWRVTNVRVVR